MQMPGYRPFMPQQEQPIHGFIYVHGIEGAYAYHLPNGSEIPLFDDDESKNIMYVKKVDQNGRATVDIIDCTPHVEQPVAEYATRRLPELQQVATTASYTRRFDPNVTAGDRIRLSYPEQGLQGIFRTTSQKIDLGYCADTEEEVEIV